MPSGWLKVLLLFPVFLFSLCVHEWAHAWVATKKGDPTPSLMGRLSLHPLAHADFMGTLVLPVLCVLMNSSFFFGWAKPVPIDSRNFKNGLRDMALVAAAGPLANIILALVSTVMLAIFMRLPFEARLVETLQLFSVVSIQVNLMLAFFNLIPIPPLDGFRVVQGFLPKPTALRLESFAPQASLLLLILMVSGGLNMLGAPVIYCFRFLLGMAIPV